MSLLLGEKKIGPHFFYKLYCFHFVARFGSYSLAARYLHVTQPTLSRSVQSLEARLKLSLLNRNTRSKIKLSLEGARVFAWSTQLLHILEGLENHRDPFLISVPSSVPIEQKKPNTDLNQHLGTLFEALTGYFKEAGSASEDKDLKILCKHLKRHSCKKRIKHTL